MARPAQPAGTTADRVLAVRLTSAEHALVGELVAHHQEELRKHQVAGSVTAAELIRSLLRHEAQRVGLREVSLLVCCSDCHVGTFEPTTVERADLSALMGLSPVEVHQAPGLRCSHCGEATWEGTTLEAIAEELARQLVADSSQLAPEEVRYLRKYLGITQAELATRLGVDRTTVARWELADRALRHGEALGLRALVALHLIAARPSLATSLLARFTTIPPAERTTPYLVSSDVPTVPSSAPATPPT